MTDTVTGTEALSNADRDASARKAFAAIEAAIDRRCPEMRGVYWTAVERLYRRDSRPDRLPEAAAGAGLDLSAAQPRSGSP
ncbi:hypothetical protein MPAR168_13115 [Methylorubrum populi]|uniref:Uncharacterized protein n=1 Tax=Methylobacterium radiotolerans TaxID=31998 RepID=A0ABU7T630_9HYPH